MWDQHHSMQNSIWKERGKSYNPIKMKHFNNARNLSAIHWTNMSVFLGTLNLLSKYTA